MTCVSERSGRASSGMLRAVQIAMAMATTVPAITRYLFSAEKRMIRLSNLLASDGREGCAQLGFRIHEEVGPRDDLVALREPRGHLDLVAAALAHLDDTRLE